MSLFHHTDLSTVTDNNTRMLVFHLLCSSDYMIKWKQTGPLCTRKHHHKTQSPWYGVIMPRAYFFLLTQHCLTENTEVQPMCLKTIGYSQLVYLKLKRISSEAIFECTSNRAKCTRECYKKTYWSGRILIKFRDTVPIFDVIVIEACWLVTTGTFVVKFARKLTCVYFGIQEAQRSRHSDLLRAGQSVDRIPAESRFSAPVKTRPRAHAASNTMSTESRPRAQLVQALRYKPEGRGFDSRWGHWNFSVT